MTVKTLKINLLGTKNLSNLALPSVTLHHAPVTLPSHRQFGHVYESGEDLHAPVHAPVHAPGMIGD